MTPSGPEEASAEGSASSECWASECRVASSGSLCPTFQEPFSEAFQPQMQAPMMTKASRVCRTLNLKPF